MLAKESAGCPNKAAGANGPASGCGGMCRLVEACVRARAALCVPMVGEMSGAQVSVCWSSLKEDWCLGCLFVRCFNLEVWRASEQPGERNFFSWYLAPLYLR